MFAGEKVQEEMNAVQRTLLTLANDGKPRPNFLYGVTQEMLRLTNSCALDLWFDDDERVCHWSLRGATPLASALVYENPVENLLEHVIADVKNDLRSDAVVLGDNAAGGEIAKPATATFINIDSLSSTAVLPFEIDEQHSGVLRLTMPPDLTEVMAAICERLAKTTGVVMAIHRSKAALTERVKELTCMYSIAQVAANTEVSLEDSTQKVAELLPQAWQYPEVAKARITLDGHSFCSEGFCEGPQSMSASILVRGIQRGQVEIFYSDLAPQFEDAHLVVAQPFLKEEYHLIQGVARELAFMVERKHAETERVTLQEQVRHADRLATIGQLAAGVAHELNEPLGSILGFAQLLAKTPNFDARATRDVGKITTAALYAREIVKKLMFFARQTPTQKTMIDLNEVVKEAADLLKMRCAKAGIKVKRDLTSNLPAIEGDRAQLQQVIVNLVVNAIQATPERGEIKIGTAACDDRVQLTVEDTGSGILPEHLDRVFLPFFTTKDVGKGTGLGLAVVHGIVSSHGGTVEVDCQSGEGARFRMLLPIRFCSNGT